MLFSKAHHRMLITESLKAQGKECKMFLIITDMLFSKAHRRKLIAESLKELGKECENVF